MTFTNADRAEMNALGSIRELLTFAALNVPWRRVTVFLARPEGQMERLDIARGPVLETEDGKRPMASRWLQEHGVGPTQLRRLFRVLVSDPKLVPWASTRRAGRAALFKFSETFTERLLALNSEFQALGATEPPVRGRAKQAQRAERVLMPYTVVAQQWLDRGSWMYGMTIDGVESVLVSLVGESKAAREFGVPLYAWYGPVRRTVKVGVRKGSDGRRYIETT